MMKNGVWLLLLCVFYLRPADHKPLLSDIERIDPNLPHLPPDSRISSGPSTPLSPEKPVWYDESFVYVNQQKKFEKNRMRRIMLNVGAGCCAATTFVLACISNPDHAPYMIGAAALTVVCSAGSVCFDCISDRITMRPIIKPRDILDNATRRSSLEPIPEM